MAVAESFRAEAFAIAGLAVNVLVRPIAGQHRIQRPVTIPAIEAQFVPLLFDIRKSE